MRSELEDLDVLVDDDDEVEPIGHELANTPKGNGPSQRELEQAQLRLLETGESSDLQLVCQGRTWNVHRSVLAQRCDFFRGAIRPEFQEQSNVVIALHEDDPDAVEDLLKYLYTLCDHIKTPALAKTHLEKGPVTLEEIDYLTELANQVKYLACILVTADKYCLPDFAKMAVDKLQDRLSRFRSRARFLNPLQATNLISVWSDALYFEDKLAALQDCQTSFAGSIVEK